MSDTVSFAEKRAHQREDRQHGVHVRILPDAESVSPHVIRFECLSGDLSRSGIRLHGHEGLSADSLVHLKVDIDDNDQHFNLMGRVVWCTETTQHEHVCGLKLSDSPNTDFAAWQTRFS